MNKSELIKTPNIRELKALIEKYNFSGVESVYLINADMYFDWYIENKNRHTMGGKVYTYDLAGALEIFLEELTYVQENY